MTFTRCSFFASENDMNVLVRGVRVSMRVGHANCVKTDSTDAKDFFYMGDADPDRVRTYPTLVAPICDLR